MRDRACNSNPCTNTITLLRGFPIARCAHVAHADRQDAKDEVSDLNNPVEIADHQRRLIQPEDYRQRADDERRDGNDPTPALGKGLGYADDPERGDRKKPEEHVHRYEIERQADPKEQAEISESSPARLRTMDAVRISIVSMGN